MHTTELRENLNVIVVRSSGQVAFDEIRDTLDELVRRPDFRPGLNLIVDFRQCETPVTADEVRRLAEYAERIDPQWGNSKWVLLASNDLTFGLARMYASLTHAHKVATRVFRTADEVNGWLRLAMTLEEILALPASTA
jgi:hypothetical protein